ncbi:MAG: phosphodiesterase [Acidimicrobiales bacterium]
MPTSPLLLAQLSDTHVVARDQTHVAGTDADHPLDPNRRLRLAVESVLAETVPVSAVVMTGDLANEGRPEQYEAIAELIAPLDVPVLAIPGNHDDRASIRTLVPGLPWVDAEHASWSMVHEGVTIIGLDTTHLGFHGAEFDDERAVWLDTALADADLAGGPTLLAMHHPPFRSGISWMDRSGFIGLERFAEVVSAHSVDRILCGHMHRPMNALVGGTIAQVGLSTVQHVALEFDVGDVTPLKMIDGPPGYLVHRFDDGTWVSHTRYIDLDARPFVPAWADEHLERNR